MLPIWQAPGQLTGLRSSPGDLEERAAERGIADPPLPARSGHYRVGDREAEPGASTIVGRPVKSVEQPLLLLGCYAGPAVLDRECDPVPALRHANPHVAGVTCVAAGVVDEDAGQAVYPLWRR